MALYKRLLVFLVLVGMFLIPETSCGGGDGSGDAVSDGEDPVPEDSISPDPDEGGTTNPDASATSDWDHPPAYIDPGTAAGNPHYSSGGRRMVRISGTTIAFGNRGTR